MNIDTECVIFGCAAGKVVPRPTFNGSALNRAVVSPYLCSVKRPLAENMFFLFQRVYRALYDYEAQDSDEVGFSEGDLIIEVNSIDAGWMTGRVERTGLTGMLPANYVELMKI